MTAARFVPLKDLVRIEYGAALKESDRNSNGPHKVYGSSGCVGRHTESLVRESTIVIGRKGSVGNVTYAPEGGWPIDTAFYTAIIDPSGLDNRYLYYALSAAHLGDRAITTSIPGLSREVIYRTKIRLPGLPEQRRIAAILDKAEAVGRKRKLAIEIAGEMAQSAFVELFGDPVANPKRWPFRKLGELLEFLTSGSRGWAQYYSDTGDPFLRIQNVGHDQLYLKDVISVRAPKNAEANRTRVKTGDVLLSITADLGRTGVVSEEIAGAFINQHLAIIRVRQGSIIPDYLSSYLASHAGQRQITRLNRQGVKAGLNFDDVRGLHIMLPPLRAQTEYAVLKTRALRLRGEQESGAEKCKHLFRVLSRELV